MAGTSRQPGPGKVFACRSPILGVTKQTRAYQLDFVEIVKTGKGAQPRKPSDASVCAFLDTSAPRSLTSGRMAFVKADAQALGRLSDRTNWKGKIVFDFDLSDPGEEDQIGLLRCLDRDKAPFCLNNTAVTEATRPLFFSDCFVKIDVAGLKEADLRGRGIGLQGRACEDHRDIRRHAGRLRPLFPPRLRTVPRPIFSEALGSHEKLDLPQSCPSPRFVGAHGPG